MTWACACGVTHDCLALTEFEIWNSIIEHKKQEAPQVIIDELEEAHSHLVVAMKILGCD
jgi:hypothetical protein